MNSVIDFIYLFVLAPLGLAFVIVNGVLMCFSPRRLAALWRWPGFDSGPQIQFRIVGVIILVLSIFFSWKLAEKILSG